MMDLISYSDGKRTLLEIAELIGQPIWKLHDIVAKLRDAGLVETA
jgi:aminopeptidase-like protein